LERCTALRCRRSASRKTHRNGQPHAHAHTHTRTHTTHDTRTNSHARTQTPAHASGTHTQAGRDSPADWRTLGTGRPLCACGKQAPVVRPAHQHEDARSLPAAHSAPCCLTQPCLPCLLPSAPPNPASPGSATAALCSGMHQRAADPSLASPPARSTDPGRIAATTRRPRVAFTARSFPPPRRSRACNSPRDSLPPAGARRLQPLRLVLHT
jgi:hypothetical protein